MKSILKLPTTFFRLNLHKIGIMNPLSPEGFRDVVALHILVFLTFFSININAQVKDTSKAETKEIRDFWKDPKPTVAASRITRAPKIDGDPTDEVWKNVAIASDFVQHRPKPYTRASQKTDIKIVYDDAAIYVLAYMYDTDIQGIRRQFGQRDDVGDIACDYLNLAFDSYNDDQNAFRFGVTAAGVQFDSRISNGNDVDRSWDAVFQLCVLRLKMCKLGASMQPVASIVWQRKTRGRALIQKWMAS
jgi:Carbohydrate family 9 binding domain-like